MNDDDGGGAVASEEDILAGTDQESIVFDEFDEGHCIFVHFFEFEERKFGLQVPDVYFWVLSCFSGGD